MWSTRLAYFCLIFLVGTPAFASTAPPSQEGSPLILSQGEQRRWLVPQLLRYSLGNSEVIRVTSDPSQPDTLVLKAIRVGETDLWVWKKDGSLIRYPLLSLGKKALAPKSSTWLRALGRLQRTEVLLTEKEAILRGPLESAEEALAIADLLAAYPTSVRDETEATPEYLRLAEERIRERLERDRLSRRLTLHREGNRLRIEGEVASADQERRLSQAIRRILPAIELRLGSVEPETPTVAFHVYLLELRKQRFQALGMRWPSPLQAALSVTTQSGIQGAANLDFALDALEGRGEARILSRPQLAVRVPGEAELFSGGELPIRRDTRSVSELSWKTFGLLLKLKAESQKGERIRLEIQTEVSQLDSQISSADIPGLRSNRMKTQIEARLGTPLFLSGLLQDSHRKQARGLPLLREIPILGALFGSSDYLEERSELVAILLPLHRPAPVLASSGIPKGRVPPSRQAPDPEHDRQLRLAEDYPWNALE